MSFEEFEAKLNEIIESCEGDERTREENMVECLRLLKQMKEEDADEVLSDYLIYKSQ